MHLLILAIAVVALGSGCTAESRKARHLDRADQYFSDGKYSEAEIEYLNALKLEPVNVRAVSQLGLIYYEQGRPARAYPFLMKACELDPNRLDLRVKAAQIHLASGDTAKAREEAEAVLSQSPTNTEALLLFVDSTRTASDAVKTRERLEQLRQQLGNSAALEVGFGSLTLREGDMAEAEAALKRAAALDPQSAPAHSALGAMYWTQNNLTNADTELKMAADLSPMRSSRRLRYADFKLRTGQLDAGKAILTEVTKSAPDYLPAWTSLAEIALAQQDLTNCASLVNQALNRDPDDHNSLLLRARLRMAQRDSDKAITELERLSTAYPKSPQALYYLALASLQKDDSVKAFRHIGQALSLYPNYDEAILLQAQLNVRKDNPDAAIAALNQLIQRNPAVAQAYLLLVSAHVSKGSLDDALTVCRRLGEAFPRNAQVPVLAGNVLLRQGKPDQARQEFEKALELAPDFLPPFEQLINLDLASQQYGAALKRIQTKQEQWPKSPVLPALFARVYLAQSETNQAEAALLKAIELDPAYQPAYLMLAGLYSSAKQNEKALEKLNQTLEKNPRDVPALMLTGMIQEQEQNYAEARAAYEKLIAINPNATAAWNNLAYICSEKLNLPDRAYEAARKARDLSPNDPFAADTLGWILVKQREYAWALSLLQSSAETFGDEQPEVQFHLGTAYYLMADEERARKALTRALASTNDFPARAEAAEFLAVLDIDSRQSGPAAQTALENRLTQKPDDPMALIKLAGLHRQRGDPQTAARLYEQALKHTPKNARLLVLLASLHSEQLGNPERAIEYAKDAYKLAPDDAQVSGTLGRLAFARGDYPWSVSLLQQTADKQANDPEILYDLAWARYSVGRVEDAADTMRSALQAGDSFLRAAQARQFLSSIDLAANPEKALQSEQQIHQILRTNTASVPYAMAAAAAAEQRGDLASASQYYETALKQYPDFLPAIRRLTLLNADSPAADQRAYDLAMKARQTFPNDPAVAGALGTVLYRRSDFRGAARLLSEAVQKGASEGKILYHLGMAQFQLKETAQSKETLERALAGNVPPAMAAEARRVLAQIAAGAD